MNKNTHLNMQLHWKYAVVKKCCLLFVAIAHWKESKKKYYIVNLNAFKKFESKYVNSPAFKSQFDMCACYIFVEINRSGLNKLCVCIYACLYVCMYIFAILYVYACVFDFYLFLYSYIYFFVFENACLHLACVI